MNLQRLDKIISSQFNVSRSTARKHIGWGRVTVNGKKYHDPSLQFDPNEVAIEYSGQALEYKEHIYLVLNKPAGIISASDDKSRETVVDLVPEHLRRNGLFPVGRLDRDTTGILLITDDGDFSHSIIHPKKKISKTYVAELDGVPTEDAVEIFKKGVVLADGTKCKEAKLVLSGGNTATVTISEGKYHQIKRMFGTLGLGVNLLKRISIGSLSLPCDLAEGECRELTKVEITKIFE